MAVHASALFLVRRNGLSRIRITRKQHENPEFDCEMKAQAELKPERCVHGLQNGLQRPRILVELACTARSKPAGSRTSPISAPLHVRAERRAGREPRGRRTPARATTPSPTWQTTSSFPAAGSPPPAAARYPSSPASGRREHRPLRIRQTHSGSSSPDSHRSPTPPMPLSFQRVAR